MTVHKNCEYPLHLRPGYRLPRLPPQDRAEYRGYCERICGGDPFSVEDTLALQLERRGPEYADLAGDSVVGLASLAVTLSSRTRLAVNGTVESVGRLLTHSINEGGAGVGAGGGPGAGRTTRCRRNIGAVRNVVSFAECQKSLRRASYGLGLLLCEK